MKVVLNVGKALNGYSTISAGAYDGEPLQVHQAITDRYGDVESVVVRAQVLADAGFKLDWNSIKEYTFAKPWGEFEIVENA